MAQASSAQREPSMEEILASIRRIIEDSDGQKQPDIASVMKPANDAVRQAAPAPAVDHPTPAAARSSEVDAFRTELKQPGAKSDVGSALSMADVQAMVDADRFAAREAAERDYRGEAPRRAPEPSFGLPQASGFDAPSWSEQREGGEAVEIDDAFDEAMSEALHDLKSVPARPASAFGQIEGSGQLGAASRTTIVSHVAERQVAAAFGELADAFAARSQRTLDTMAEDLMRPMLQDWLDNNLPLLVERLVREEIERIARGS